jgi:hypothetical protein
VEELGLFLNESVAAGTEGLIVKTLDSTYEPSRRSAHWLKLKKDYLEGVGDTFDVAVIGAWLGKCAPRRDAALLHATRTPTQQRSAAESCLAAILGVRWRRQCALAMRAGCTSRPKARRRRRESTYY